MQARSTSDAVQQGAGTLGFNEHSRGLAQCGTMEDAGLCERAAAERGCRRASKAVQGIGGDFEGKLTRIPHCML